MVDGLLVVECCLTYGGIDLVVVWSIVCASPFIALVLVLL